MEIRGWDYFIVRDYEIEKSLKIFASYNKEENVIFLNPFIDKICGKYGKEFMVAIIISKIAHEMRHVWQIKHHYDEYEWDRYESYGNIGDEYIYNKAEIDAFAFEEVVLKVLFDNPSQELDITCLEVH